MLKSSKGAYFTEEKVQARERRSGISLLNFFVLRSEFRSYVINKRKNELNRIDRRRMQEKRKKKFQTFVEQSMYIFVCV